MRLCRTAARLPRRNSCKHNILCRVLFTHTDNMQKKYFSHLVKQKKTGYNKKKISMRGCFGMRPLRHRIAKNAAQLAPVAVVAGHLLHQGRKLCRNVRTAFHPNERKDVITMKKSTFAAIIALLAAIAGALGAAFFYLRRREEELDEYEQLLFSEDYSDEMDEMPKQAEEEPADEE